MTLRLLAGPAPRGRFAAGLARVVATGGGIDLVRNGFRVLEACSG
jgi:hypothetical protein